MSAKPLIIFGLGDFGRIARLYFERFGGRVVTAFCVDEPKASTFEGLPVLAADALPSTDQAELFIAIGYSKVNKTRAAVFSRFKAAGYTLASLVHPSVTLWEGTKIGENVMIFENNVVQPGVTLGDDVIIWSHNHIGHDASVGAHVFVSSEVCIAGRAAIGERSFLGINATIRDGITVGAGCIVGAGALLLSDAAEDGVYLADETPRHRLPASRLRGF
ncbi:MAG: acetyltransferase [Pseudomonadota bacterium]